MAAIQIYRTLYGSLSRTATPVAAQYNDLDHARIGGHFVIDVTAGSTLSITPSIQAFDTASQKWYDLLVGVAITATGTTILRVYPGVAPTANVAASDIVPPIWRFLMAHGNANPATYTVSSFMRD